jgi:hypothetical protein
VEFVKLHKKMFVLALVAFACGVLWITAVRFILYSPSSVHYHANFAVFIDGERLPFANPLYYEEVQSCSSGDESNPKIRVHMHDRVNHVIHVHDAGATWGHFFANVGMTNGDIVFRNDSAVYVEDEQTKIHFILNGEEVDTTANRAIKSEDTLLVSIGNPTEEQLNEQYAQIEKNAAEYNLRDDPSSCTGSAEATFIERLQYSVGFQQ